jgi:hypothetical protein
MYTKRSPIWNTDFRRGSNSGYAQSADAAAAADAKKRGRPSNEELRRRAMMVSSTSQSG